MKQVWIASLTFVASATTALAQDEALPQAVGDAYLAYESALASNDHEAASEAAELAWRAAQHRLPHRREAEALVTRT